MGEAAQGEAIASTTTAYSPLVNPCDTCEVEDCHDICKPRAEYWDAAMERIRKQVGL